MGSEQTLTNVDRDVSYTMHDVDLLKYLVGMGMATQLGNVAI